MVDIPLLACLKIAKSDYQPFQVCLSVCLSTWNNSAHTELIFIKFDIGAPFENLARKSQFH